MSVWQPSGTSPGQEAVRQALGPSWPAGGAEGTGHGSPRGYMARRSMGRRLTGITVVVLLHAGIIYAVMTGLGRQAIEVIRAPLETKIIEATPPPPVTPPPPKLAEPPPPYIPPPDIQIQPQQDSRAIQVTTAVKPKSPAPAPLVPDSEVSEQAISGPPLVYPPSMVELGIQGSADIECTVDVDGSTSDCKIDGTTGDATFGDEALKHAVKARFKPAVRDGRAIKARHRWHVMFRLNG